jgi:hypothetical protein
MNLNSRSMQKKSWPESIGRESLGAKAGGG